MPWNEGLTGPALEFAGSRQLVLRALAGPGTGKTFALIRRVARLLEEGVEPERIMVLTFARTAAHDLVAALRQLGEEGYGEVRAKTLHSYCFSLLSRSGVLTATHRVPRILMEFERDCALWDLVGPFGGILQRRSMAEAFEAAWARRQTDDPGEPVEGLDQQFQDGLRQWLRWHRGMLVGELVPEALAYLRHNPQSPELTAFDHVLVDEYQDLNRAEQDLIDLISSRGSLAIIGDDDQSIYSFKWANPDGIRTFHTHHPGTADVMLEECRRCPTHVVELARTLAERDGARPGNHRLLPRQGNRVGEVHNIQWTSIPAEARGVARFIAARIRDGTPPGQCLVLAPRRVIGYAIRDALLGLGVEADTYFKEEPVESERAQRALTLLTLLISPEDRVSLRAWFGFGSPNRRQAPYRRALQVAQELNTDVASTVAEVAEGERLLAYSAPLVERYRSLNAERDALRPLIDNLSGLIDVVLPSGEPDVALLRSIALDAEAEANGDPDDFLSLVRASISQPEVPLAATRPRNHVVVQVEGPDR